MLLLSIPAYALTVETCIDNDPCTLVKITPGAQVYVYTTSGVDQANIQLASLGLQNKLTAIAVNQDEYNQIRKVDGAATTKLSKEEIKNNLNMTESEARDVEICLVSANVCALSAGAMGRNFWAGLSGFVVGCTMGYLSCDEAIESINEYAARVTENLKLLEQMEREEYEKAKKEEAEKAKPATKPSSSGGDPKPGKGPATGVPGKPASAGTWTPGSGWKPEGAGGKIPMVTIVDDPK